MHSDFRQQLLRDNERNLERRARTAFLLSEPRGAPAAEPVALRLCCVHDDDNRVLEQLAVLEGRATPTGPHVLAEVGGTVVAALPLGPGDVLADPFRPTAHLVPLLELRAKQLTNNRPRRRSLGLLTAVLGWGRA